MALHYEDDTGKQINQKYIIDDDGWADCDDVASFEDEWEAYDPNCVERFGGYGGWGGFRFPQFQQQPQFLQQQPQYPVLGGR